MNPVENVGLRPNRLTSWVDGKRLPFAVVLGVEGAGVPDGAVIHIDEFDGTKIRVTIEGSREALRAELEDSLVRYHNLDGAGNGSPSKAPQLAPGIASVDAQRVAIQKLAAFVAQQPGIRFRASPEKDPERAEFRQQIEVETRAMVDAFRSPERYAEAVKQIANPEIRALVTKALADVPPQFYEAPSSASRKYHPADEINPGGLAMHSLRVLAMAKIVARFYGVEGDELDMELAADILHDTAKHHRPWGAYAPDHGPLAAQWLRELWGTTDPRAEMICDLVSNHMAQWNKPVSTPPKDESNGADPVAARRALLNQIMSYADYLAAQDNVYVTV